VPKKSVKFITQIIVKLSIVSVFEVKFETEAGFAIEKT